MKSFHAAKLLLANIAASSIICLSASAQDEEPGGYLFFGTEASAEADKSHFPIVSVDNKNIYVDGGTKVRKVSHRADVRTRPELKLSERYAEVLDIRFNTSSMANLQRAAQLVSDMQFQQQQSELEVAILKSQMEGNIGDSDLSAADQAIATRIDDVQQDTSDFQDSMQDALDTGAFEIDELVDSVHVRATFDPITDVPDAYCVIVVNYDIMDIETREIEGRNRIARVRYIGDLRRGELADIRVRVALTEFPKDSAEFEFHLFTGEGEQVALSTSRGLKPLTPEEVATFKELEAKTSPLDRG